MQSLSLAIIAALFLSACGAKTSNEPWRNPKVTVERRAEDLLRRLTLEEKLDLLSGDGWMSSHGIPRLGVPPIRMADGPVGIRSWAMPGAPDKPDAPQKVRATAFPAGIAMAATWNPDLVAKEARVIAQEALALGRNQVLGPTVNVARTPLAGRNFEGYGEDPWLTSRMGVAYIGALQAEGVIATVKHFAANNQETRRNTIDILVDQRTLEEIYLPAFRAAVEEAGVWSVMSAYNKVNGTWAAENPDLLNEILRKRWGFKGFVVSDWAGTHSTAPSVNAGLDLEMPGSSVMPALQDIFKNFPGGNPGFDGGYLAQAKLKAMVASGEIAEATFNESIRRILRVLISSGALDPKTLQPDPSDAPPAVDSPDHRAVARAAADQSIVLLRNEQNLLPLDLQKFHTVALIGPNADINRVGGGGSSAVTPDYSWKPSDGIRERAAGKMQVTYALGATLEGEQESAPAAVLLKEATDLAARSDLAIVFVGFSAALEGEMADRKSLSLPAGQDDLIQAVARANKNTIVVINSGSPVDVSKWLAQVPAVVEAWYPGQEGGHAIADVLFGDFNPSGKLPITFPKSMADSFAPLDAAKGEYKEGIFVGYRHFDRKNTQPAFAFGHGLSYTTFDYSNLTVTPASPRYGQTVTVRVSVKNTGSRAGAEVVQVYIHDVKSSVERPVKELKAFQRVDLKPGEEQVVTMTLDRRSMWFYDPLVKDWAAEPGEFDVLVGASSRDIRLKGKFTLYE